MSVYHRNILIAASDALSTAFNQLHGAGLEGGTIDLDTLRQARDAARRGFEYLESLHNTARLAKQGTVDDEAEGFCDYCGCVTEVGANICSACSDAA